MTALTEAELALLEDACTLSSFHYLKALQDQPRIAAAYDIYRFRIERAGGPAVAFDLVEQMHDFITRNGLKRAPLPDYYFEPEWAVKVDTFKRRAAELLRYQRQKKYGDDDPITLGRTITFG